MISTLLAQWLRRLETLCEVMGSIPHRIKFFLFKNMYKTICFCTLNVCTYLVYVWHDQVLDTYVHKHICRNNMYVYICYIDNDL